MTSDFEQWAIQAFSLDNPDLQAAYFEVGSNGKYCSVSIRAAWAAWRHQQERVDALAAHVDEARQIANHWLENEQTTANVWELARKIGRWSLSVPETSLACLKLLERAKGMADAARRVNNMSHPKAADFFKQGVVNHLEYQAAELRRQAEGDVS